jgi:prophage DNA circulation protein
MGILDQLKTIGGDGRPVVLPDRDADRLPASFRGVDVWVSAYEAILGRRQAVHEFPTSEDDPDREPYAEDLGPVTGRFTVDLFLIGADIGADRVYLEEALNTPGVGKLVLPIRGEAKVKVDGQVRMRWETGQLKKLTYSVPFVVSGEQPQPILEFGLDTDVGAAADVVNALVVGGADSLLDTSGPSFLGDSIVADMQAAVAVLQKVNGTIAGQLNVIDAAAGAITSFAGELSTLIATPALLAASLQGLVNSVLNGVQAVRSSIERYDRGDAVTNRARAALALSQTKALGFSGEEMTPRTGTTGTALTEANNQNATKDIVEAAAVSEGARAIARLPFESAQQAEQAYQAMEEVFDRVLDRGTVPDDVDGAIRDLRVAFRRYIERRSTQLSIVTTYTPQWTMPLLLVAHDVHGDATRDEEIALRNNVEHPGFAPGQRALEVLVD